EAPFRAFRYAPVPPFHLSNYGAKQKQPPPDQHQLKTQFTGNDNGTTSDSATRILYRLALENNNIFVPKRFSISQIGKILTSPLIECEE
ncbi:hypothetical protein, partial [Roseibacillus persicicus]|uniref:hypothetical protein n=1 Tax=Roseibacillus persicicus TaxID=454148 RepID=UPI001E30BC3D